MSRREDFDNALWSDPDFLALSTEARMTYIWTWTNPRCGMAGIYKVALAQAALETGIPTERLEVAFAELGEARFSFYDRGVIFVRTRVKHLRTKTEQIAKAIRSDVQKVADDHPLKASWIAENGAAVWLGRHLGYEVQWSLTEPSPEVHKNGSLEPKSGGSVEPHPRLHGNGNGKGTGKGPQGRGAGRGAVAPPERQAFERMVAENFPDTPADLVRLAIRQLGEDGEDATIEAIGRRLAVPSENAA